METQTISSQTMGGLAKALGVDLKAQGLPRYDEQYRKALQDLAKPLAAVLLMEERGREEVLAENAAERAARGALPGLERSLLRLSPHSSPDQVYVRLAALEQMLGSCCPDPRRALQTLANAGLITSVTRYCGSGEYDLLGYRINPKKREEVLEFLKRQGLLDGNVH